MRLIGLLMMAAGLAAEPPPPRRQGEGYRADPSRSPERPIPPPSGSRIKGPRPTRVIVDDPPELEVPRPRTDRKARRARTRARKARRGW